MIIISVGTSLLNNLLNPLCEINNIFKGRENHKDNIEKIVNDFAKKDPKLNEQRIKEFFTNGLNACNGKFTAFNDYIKFFAINNSNKILANIKKRTGNINPDILPAEISSLFLYYYDVDGKKRDDTELEIKDDNTTKDRIILLCTETADSVLCALIIKEIIEKSNYFKDKCEVLENHDVNDPYDSKNGIVVIENLDMVNKADKWIMWNNDNLDADCGLLKLLGYIEEKKNNIKLIIRSGSYKELSSDLLLLSAQFELPSYYLFENTTTAILNIPQNGVPYLVENLFQKPNLNY